MRKPKSNDRPPAQARGRKTGGVKPVRKPVSKSEPQSSRRQEASDHKRQAILSAALDVFSANGFAAARLDEVALRAGVAKGTIYLFFKDKEDLFEQMVVGAADPVLSRARILTEAQDVPFDAVLERLFTLFRTEVLSTRRKDIALLVIGEGARFPRIAAFYHREVIARMLDLVRRLAERGHAEGRLNSADLVRFPQLVVAPMVMSLIWRNVFSKSEALDVEGMLDAHRALLTAPLKRRKRRPS